MGTRDNMVKYIREALSALGSVDVKKMLGGYGIYYNDNFFGIISRDKLYFKVDEHTNNRFEYPDQISMPYTGCEEYRLVINSMMEDHRQLVSLAKSSIQAAKRSKKHSYTK